MQCIISFSLSFFFRKKKQFQKYKKKIKKIQKNHLKKTFDCLKYFSAKFA